MRRPLLASLTLATLLRAAPARAAAPELLGGSPRSAALAQSDATSTDAASASLVSPTAAASDGIRGMIAYGVGLPVFSLRGASVSLPAVRGTTFGIQTGARLGGGPSIGLALGGYLPDRGLATIAFRPASEPVFLRHEAATAKATFDVVAAIGDRLRFALGASVGAGTQGRGVDVTLAQDGRGVHSDGAVDLAVAYRLSPVLALGYRADDGLAAAMRLRGARSFQTNLDATTTVTFRDNPLSGTTTVRLRGDAAYDPLLVDLGISQNFHLWKNWTTTLFLSLRYERWSAAPSPVADAQIELDLVLRPFVRQETFTPPPLRDTVAPRLGLEATSPGRLLAFRAGYAYVPSPLEEPRGYLTPLAPTTHEFTAGAGLSLQTLRSWPLPFSVDLATGVQWAPEREARKENLALPWARYTVGGVLPHAMLGITAEVD